jgi:putative DNA primase/helicase
VKTDIKQECIGRWSGILTNLGINAELFSGKHQPCVFCGGKDRARWDRAKEFYYCSQCGSRQPIDMAIEFTGLSFKDTTNLIRPNVMNTPLKIVKPVDTHQNEARIKKIHAGLKRITPDSVVALYLAKRGITVFPEQDCYQIDQLDYWDGGEKSIHPAMVSVFRTPAGEVSTYHVTYLSNDGTKANVPIPRKILPVIKPLVGAAIRLFKADDTLAIAEGVETALCVTEDSGVPCWAAGSAQAMNNVVIPESVKVVWIYADSDESFTGQKAAYDLANRLKVKEGKTVRVVTLINQDSVEDYGVKYDYNDLAILKANA